MDFHYDGTEPSKPPFNKGPNAASSSNPFSRSLPVGSADDAKTMDAHTLKRQGTDLTFFEVLQHPKPYFNAPKDRLIQLEKQTDSAHTAVTKNFKSEVGLLQSRLTDLHNKVEKQLKTEIGALPDDLVALRCHFLKGEDDISQIQQPLTGQAETLSNLNHVHDTILIRLDGFPMAHAQAHDRLNRLEAVTESPVPKAAVPVPPLVDSFPILPAA